MKWRAITVFTFALQNVVQTSYKNQSEPAKYYAAQ